MNKSLHQPKMAIRGQLQLRLKNAKSYLAEQNGHIVNGRSFAY